MLKMFYLILSFSSFYITNSFVIANSSSCGDWIPFQLEKCIKIFDKVENYEDAKRTCNNQEVGQPSLLMIKSSEEQKFIENLLFYQNEIVEFG